jgi:formate hydrogenlyase subunit 6/NADH:ubiquinone oxidoreductase subunit I
MFDNLLKLLSSVTNVAPEYHREHCIAAKQSVAACQVCKDVCPHQAIKLKRFVEIDDVDCTGCGLCVQSCPSQALESKPSFQPGAPLKCSQVKGSAQSIQCLGRLTPTDLLRLAGTKEKVTLVRNDCAKCKIGTEKIPEVLDEGVARAKMLAEFRKRNLEFQIIQQEKYDTTDNPDKISRRDLLRGGFRSLQTSAADALAPLDSMGETRSNEKHVSLPREMQRHYALIEKAKPAAEDLVPWELPRVKEGCIMCPVCTNVCPTKAFSRDFKPKDKDGNELGGSVLSLEPNHCNGCNACVKACPVKVISLDTNVTWQELSGGKETAFHKKPLEPKLGVVARGE